MTQDNERDIARATFFAAKKQAFSRLATALGADEDEIERRLLNDTIRTSSICVTPPDLQDPDTITGERKLHMATCEFCTGVMQAMEQPVAASHMEQFLTALREQEKPLEASEILVVDDEEHTRAFLSAVFTKAGAHVTSVGTAKEALVQVKQKKKIDGLISDIDLGDPDRDGYAVLSAMQNAARAPFFSIAVTAHPEERAKSFAAGFNCFFEKPVDANTLTAAAFELQRRINGADEIREVAVEF